MLLPTDLAIAADVTLAVPALYAKCKELLSKRDDTAARIEARFKALELKHTETRQRWSTQAAEAASRSPIAPAFLAQELREAIKDDDWVLTNGSLDGWARRLWSWDKPYQFVRTPGLGYGIGISLGAALAHKATGRLVVDLQPDGDLLYTASGLWTAAHHKVPLLIVMHNNRSYFNDELHQAAMAEMRGRQVENKVIGIRIEDPPVDFAAMASSYGVHSEGPIEDPSLLRPALERAARYVREKKLPALFDVVCERRERTGAV